MSQAPFLRSRLVFAVVLGCLSLPALARADDEEDFKRLKSRCWEEMDKPNLREAERLALELKRMAEEPLANSQKHIADALRTLGSVYSNQRRYTEAESLLSQALSVAESLGEPHKVAVCLSSLGFLRCRQGRYAEAEQLERKSMNMMEKTFGREHLFIAPYLADLAIICRDLGRYEEAEMLARRALTIRETSLGSEHEEVAQSLDTIADVYKEQGRYAEAEPLYKRSLSILDNIYGTVHQREWGVLDSLGRLYLDQARFGEAEAFCRDSMEIGKKAFGDQSPEVAQNLCNLALIYSAQRRHTAAERLFRQALAINERYRGAEHIIVAVDLLNLANQCLHQGRYAEAEQFYNRALSINEKVYGAAHPKTAMCLHGLGCLATERGQYGKAEVLFDRVIALKEQGGANVQSIWTAYWKRADIRWKRDNRGGAVKDLMHALELVEIQRGKVSGTDAERGAFFAYWGYLFEVMVSWQAQLQNAEEGFGALERSRARGFVDQVRTHGLDLLAGVPNKETQDLRQREAQALTHLASVRRQLQLLDTRKDLSAQQKAKQSEQLEHETRNAQWEVAQAYAAIRNVSPAYQLALGKDFKPVPLKRLQSWITEQDALLLEYLAGSEGGYVLVVPADGKARLETLAIDKTQAEVLGADAGPLTGKRLSALLITEKSAGVLDQLRNADSAEAVQKIAPALTVLWEVLIPEKERQAVLAGKYKRLIVLPDGPMAKLPFETLVVEKGDTPKYLLDVGPAIEYAPSATILMNLTERQGGNAESRSTEKGPHPSPLPKGEGTTEREAVLTVGDCRYGEPTQLDEKDVLAQLTPRARYGTLGGQLKSLPNSATEIRWVADVFGEKGTKVAWLKGDLATEAAVRFNAPGRRILHFACHGLVDESYGNLFGALALTPGPNPDDPADDGFLTLAEVYGMNLKGCELAILSACDTNVGPQQRGEGIWALSRGFLVAGSRRVVASNWLVDDEAAPNFVSYFTSIIAKAEKEGKTPDYAQAVHDAKLFLRHHQNKKWHNPYYWGTFVLIGPN